MANILWILPGEEKKLWYIRDQGMQYTKVCVCQCLRKGPSRFNQQGQCHLGFTYCILFLHDFTSISSIHVYLMIAMVDLWQAHHRLGEGVPAANGHLSRKFCFYLHIALAQTFQKIVVREKVRQNGRLGMACYFFKISGNIQINVVK